MRRVEHAVGSRDQLRCARRGRRITSAPSQEKEYALIRRHVAGRGKPQPSRNLFASAQTWNAGRHRVLTPRGDPRLNRLRRDSYEPIRRNHHRHRTLACRRHALGARTRRARPASPHHHSQRSASSMNMGSQMGVMDEHMKQMQALHDKMMNAKTPEERQAVMEEQRKAMQAGMGTMHQMRGGGMMGGMGGGMMGQKGKPADMPTQMQMMQKRMDMMQMMMQTMMDQQGMTGTPKAGR